MPHGMAVTFSDLADYTLLSHRFGTRAPQEIKGKPPDRGNVSAAVEIWKPVSGKIDPED